MPALWLLSWLLTLLALNIGESLDQSAKPADIQASHEYVLNSGF